MLEAASIPILVKALDFLFDESRKILQERRERRQKENPAPAPAPQSAPEIPPQPVIQTKSAALELKISQTDWVGVQSQVEHLTSLLAIHVRNHQLVSKQAALWGEALLPPILANNLLHEEREIAKLTRELQQLLSKTCAQKMEAVSDEQFYE